jgi:ribosomal protein S18 acetylase RimI-like enzyme
VIREGAPPTIRSARATDVPALSDLAKRTWTEAFGADLAGEDEAAELETTRSESYFVRALEEKTILVAEAEDGLVGYVQFGEVEIPEVEVQPGDRGLHRLYLDTAWHGHGLGRRLLEAALRHPRLAEAERIFLQVWDENDRAIRLYESFAFRRVGTTRFSVGSEVMEDAIFVLERKQAPSRL